ncbi:MAG TPA: ribonuclease G [Usitatibacteraceae bacterium]|nr:ribonuclease G [Usitatibacteraceae bacterium]
MNEQILINVTPQETRVAVLEQGAVQELHVERTSNRGLVGNIYLGRVGRVLPGMQSAFIEIGLARAAFLHVADVWPAGKNGEQKPIEKLLHEGQTLVVQVIKDPIGSKGARLSTQISIAGRLLVYLPGEQHIGISQRIEDEAEREHLRERLQLLMPQGEAGGFIVRTVAETASDEELTADIEYLGTLWRSLEEASRSAAPQTLLYQDLDLAQRVLRDLVTRETERIIVDSRETHSRVLEFAGRYMRRSVAALEHYHGERPLFDLFAVEDEIARALERRVDLKSGGYVIIDQTEALTTIDVNTGAFVSGRSFDDTIFKTNLEATQAIARQLRLRNLGGIIIVDFIDMDSVEHKNAVLAEFNKALARDRTRITVNGFTQLGLVEMTRKRTRESLAHVLCEPCPTCAGRGEIRSAQTVCYEILREILRSARQFDAKEFRILASQTVIDRFLDEEANSMTALEDFIKKPITLSVETSYTQEQYDVILV